MNTPYRHMQAWAGEFAALRRDLHAHPELGFEESRTSEIVARQLTAWGVEVHRGIAATGVVGVIHGNRKTSAHTQTAQTSRAIGLRADMDALPVEERNTFAHRSTHAGRMHACGHDGHTAMLLAAARYLAHTRNFTGTTYVIFQPAEEGRGGAKRMLDEGLFQRFAVDEVYALHNWPRLPAGAIAVRPGAMMAASDRFRILVNGVGGHAAMPEHAVDPVIVAAQLITAVQTLVSRNVSAHEQAVVTITSVTIGAPDTFNVIADRAELIGIIRSFTPDTRELIGRRLAELAQTLPRAFGASGTFEYVKRGLATINTPAEAEYAALAAEAVVGKANVMREFQPAMTAEDFAWMLAAKPGAYIWLGQGGAENTANAENKLGSCDLHNPHFDFNDGVLLTGAALFATLAEQRLA
jgi:amidohydrolase